MLREVPMGRNIVNITEDAKEYINQRCDGVNTIVAVKINSKGCSGHKYEYSLIHPTKVGSMDEIIMWEGGGIAISAFSVMHMIGSTLDVKKSAMEEILHWINPNAINQCGCGESFSLG